MNDMNDNIDNNLEQMKRRWRDLNNLDTGSVDTALVSLANSGKTISRRKKLMRTYRVLTIIAAIYVVLGPMTFYGVGIGSTWMLIVIGLFFALMSLMSYNLYSQTKQLDFSTLTTIQLLERVERLMTSFVRQTYIGMTLVGPVLGIMLYSMRHDRATLLGGVCGAILGLVIGLMKNHHIKNTIKQIRADLRYSQEA